MVELHLRITTDAFTLENVREFIVGVNVTKYIIGQEVIPYNHYHCHFDYDCGNFTQYQKKKLGKRVVEHFNLTEGNKQYGISQDRGNSEIYTVKDGKYIYEGYTPDQIQEFFSQSVSKITFKTLLENIKKIYLDTVIQRYNDKPYQDYCYAYIEAHVEHHRPLSDFRIEAHFRSMYLLKFPGMIRTYTGNLMRNAQVRDHSCY